MLLFRVHPTHFERLAWSIPHFLSHVQCYTNSATLAIIASAFAHIDSTTVNTNPPNRKGISQEWEVLVACAQQRNGFPKSRCSEVDWENLIRLALSHGMAPLLGSYLEQHAGSMPEGPSRRLQQTHAQALRHNLRLCTHLLQALRALDTCGVSAIPFKGPLLAERLYGNVALRQSSDLDVIVRPEDVPAAVHTLREVGFKSRQRLSPKLLSALTMADFELSLVRDGLYLELHWDVMPRFYGINFGLGEAWQRSRRVGAGGSTVLEFAPEDLFLALTLHGSKHYWARLIWLCDLAQLLYVTRTFDWHLLLTRARGMRVERLLFVAFALLQEVLQVSLPSDMGLLVHMKQDPRSRNAFAMAKSNLCRSEPEEQGFRTYRFFLSARDSHADAVRQVIRHAMTPSGDELLGTGRALPKAVYLLLHVWRLVRKTARFAWRLVRRERDRADQETAVSAS
ncbi:MAG TPA: nucleotidyltransferase family protein [Terriglobales bacterium]|nr:nucleotidyltransferase family protein [Terriglobales bacterium]